MFRRSLTGNRFIMGLIVFILAIGMAATQGGAKAKADPCGESGTLGSNETWTSSCVYVVDNVIVPSGVTLTIDPGTVVKLSGESDIGIEVDSGGTLDVSGTSDSNVNFTSLNDDSVGGTTSGSDDSPEVSDYNTAISMNGGTADVTYANFEYAITGIGDRDSYNSFLAGGSDLTVEDSTFTNSYNGVAQNNNGSLSLESNDFALGTADDGGYAITADSDPDLSGIVLSGDNENTFSGSGANLWVSVDGDLPSDSNWTVDSGSGAQLVIDYTTTVEGTLTVDSGTTLINNSYIKDTGTINLDSGVIVKAAGEDSYGIEVNTAGTLDVSGTSDNPVVFTSLNDDTEGGTTYGSNDSPAVGDYNDAILTNGGVVDVTHADFEYAVNAIYSYLFDDLLSAGSEVSISNSSFTNDEQGITQYGDVSFVLESNSFDLGTASDGGNAITSGDDADLSGIVLTGDDENTFSGSGTNLVVQVDGSVPSESTWNIDTSSGGSVLLDSNVDVEGSVNIDPGTVIKIYDGENGFDILTGGEFDATGSLESPVVFTSYGDSSIGDDVNGDPSSTGSSGEYNYAVRFEDPSDSDYIKWDVFKYASQALDLGVDGSFTTLTVEDSQFSYNEAALGADTTSVEFGELGGLESDCTYPYPEYYNLDNDWFGSTSLYGYPGDSSDLSSYLGLVMPDPSDYPGLSDVYSDFTTIDSETESLGDNTMPWTLFECSIDGVGTVEFPVTPVLPESFADYSAIASDPLWTVDNLKEE